MNTIPYLKWVHFFNLSFALGPDLEKEGQESRISLPCWAVLTSLSVFLSGLWASPLLLFSAQKLAWKRETWSAGLLQCVRDLTLLSFFLPAAKPTGLGEHLTQRPSFYPSVISSFVALWLRLGHETSLGKIWLPREKLNTSGKFESLGKNLLPWEKLTPSGKFDSLRKSWLPQENLTSSGKVDSLGEKWLPREK